MAPGNGSGDQRLARVADAGRTGVGDETDNGATIQEVDHLLAGGPFGVFVDDDQVRRSDARVTQ